MNCPNCGGTVPPGTQRCLKCGSYIEQQAPPPVQQPPVQPVPGVPQQPIYQPVAGVPKSKLTAGLLGIFLGGLGIHRFYLGYSGIGVAQILVTMFTCGIGWLWGFIEGIMILVGSGITTDANGVPLGD